MNAVVLPHKIYTPLQQVAKEQGRHVNTIVEELVEGYLHEYRSQQLLEEMGRFRAQHAQLKEEYLGQFIGFYNGEVLGHDDDGGELYYRLHKQYGSLPILIVEVTESPEQEFTIRTPKLDLIP